MWAWEEVRPYTERWEITMTRKLENKRALVTDRSRGIGAGFNA